MDVCVTVKQLEENMPVYDAKGKELADALYVMHRAKITWYIHSAADQTSASHAGWLNYERMHNALFHRRANGAI
jgi:hypothetical protein